MKWINALGIVFQFLAFWFAAPELLGEATLKRFEKGLKKMIALIPIVIPVIIVLVSSLGFSITGIIKGLNASKEGMEASSFMQYIIVLSVFSVCYVIFLIYYKKIRAYLEVKVAWPLANKLINSDEIRKSALIIGAVLFTLGFVLILFSSLMI